MMWSHSPTALPVGGAPTESSELPLAVTRAFLQEEQQTARSLRDLAHTARGTYGGLLELLLDWMALDSQKHERALRFVQQRLEQKR
jgi:hypothetical protein